MNFKDISYNFAIAKVIAILMVVTGHYFKGILWIPTTFALFVFAFSSGYFTAFKYKYPVNKKKFWNAKISRLFYPVLVIDIFLFLLFLVKNHPGIFVWQTIPSLIGMNGFFAWFKLGNPSPFGIGLWFFTLLILFYLFYPLLAFLFKKRSTASLVIIFFLTLTTILQYLIPMSHMLWINLFAFVFGSYFYYYEINISPMTIIFIFVISSLLLIFFNTIFLFDDINYIFILISSVTISILLTKIKLPYFIISKLLLISNCVIHIYFIHTYLFIRSFTQFPLINYTISLFIIITVALILAKITEILTTLSARKGLSLV